MSSVLGVAGPSAYWYLARGTGAVSLVLLTASVVLGVLGSVRFTAGPRWPRFAIDTLHREVSLLVLVLLAAHILTSVLDGFAPIRLIDAVIPFVSPYRPLWLGLGALSFDLLIALVVTSLVRRRLGYRAWRAIHWLAYASWPVAVLHGLGTGTDTKVWWMLALTAACVAAVVVAVCVRIGSAVEEPAGVRGGAIALVVATPLALAIFTLAGPLQKGWAHRAGTPASLFRSSLTAASAPASAAGGASATGTSSGAGAAGATGTSSGAGAAAATAATRVRLRTPFTAHLSGTAKQTAQAGGAIIDLALRLSGGAHGRLRVRMAGAPLDGGGLSMTGSQVDLLADGSPVLEGEITSLQGNEFVARVQDGSGSQVSLHALVSIDSNTGAVTGTLSGTKR
jgi:sulfoxide reductase heme-binding subunit YedZ